MIAWLFAGLVLTSVAATVLAATMGRRSAAFRFSALGFVLVLITVGLILLRSPHDTGSVADVAPDAAGEPGGPDSSAADSLVAEAERALNLGDTAAAARMYGQALVIYNQLGDIVGQGDVYLGLGRMEHFTGQSASARPHFDQALALYRRSGRAAEEARALAARADLEKDTFNWAEAAHFYRDAREAWARAPEPKTDPHIVFRMADAPLMLEGEAEARSVLAQAEMIFEALDDPEGLGDVRVLKGTLQLNVGTLGAARGDFSDAQALFKRAGAQEKLAASALEGARIDIQFADNRSAREALDAAMAAFSSIGSETGLALAKAISGDLNRLLGRMEDASAEYRSAADALQALAYPEAANVLLKLGQVERHRGNPGAARAPLEAAVRLFRESGSSVGEAWAVLALGVLEVEAGGGEDAEGLLTAAAGRFREVENPLGEGRAHLALASLAESRELPDLARTSYAIAAARFVEAGGPFGQLLAELGLGDIARGAGDSDTAMSAYRKGAALFLAMDAPVAETNRHLGLPAVNHLKRLNEDLPMGEGLARADVEGVNAETLAAFPDHNIEARTLLAATEVRLAAAQAYLQGLN